MRKRNQSAASSTSPETVSLIRWTLPLAAASGVTLGLSTAPREWPGLAFFSMPLLLLAIEACESPRRAILVGWVAGITTNAVALYWVIGLLEAFAHFPLGIAVLVASLLFLAQGLTTAFAAYLAAPLIARWKLGYLILPATMTVCFSFVPGLFPWRPCVPLVSLTSWAQIAEIGGEPLLDFVAGVAGCALLEGWRRRKLVPLALGAFAVLGPIGYGLVRIEQLHEQRAEAPRIRIGVVQPNIGIEDKHDPSKAFEHLARLQEMTEDLGDRGVDLTVWPESAYPFSLVRGERHDRGGPFSARGDRIRAPLLFGAVTARSQCEQYNSVLAMDENGAIRGVSDKVRLLAFGEYVPLWEYLPPLQHFFPCRGFVPGHAPEVLELAGARIGVLNCYEDVLRDQARIVALDEPDILVNVTNDAWFGDSDEPHLHHQFARLRTIESRRELVRSVNTGVSGHILATGEDAFRTATFVQTSFVADARLLKEETLWTRAGDVISPALFGALLGAAFAMRRSMTRAG